MVRLEHVLDSWRAVRQDTVAAVEDFPAADFDFRPVADVQSFREVARHILIAGHGLSGLLLAGETNLAVPDIRDRIGRLAPPLPEGGAPAELAAGLRQSIDQRLGELAAQPAEFFDQTITRMDGAQVTRLEMVQMLKEHELTHRAQLFMYLRMKGIVPATTRRRMPKPAAK